MNLLWTVVAAVAASLSAIVAAIYTWITFRLVRAQGEPKVVVYACADPERESLIILRIANIGHDVATDISFEASRPIPSRAYGLTENSTTGTAEVMTSGPLIDGIPTLGPGDKRDTTWGQIGGLLKAVGREPIDLTIEYKHGRRKLRGFSRLEVASFDGTDASEKPNALTARSLKKIAKSIDLIEQHIRPPQKPQTPGQHVLEVIAAQMGATVTVRPKPKPATSHEPSDGEP